jgi:hypothetical protein
VFFVVSGWMPFYYLAMIVIFFVAFIYVIDFGYFFKMVFKGQVNNYISLIPVKSVSSVVGSLVVLVMFYYSYPSLVSMSGAFGHILLAIVKAGVVYTFLVKAYKKFVFKR